MIAPHVGVNRFTRPLAELKIMTIVSTEKPRFAASGPMIGIDTVAMPELDGTRKDRTTYRNHEAGAKMKAETP